jgi:hypothetical protein
MGGSATEALVGAWENVVAIEMSGDFQTVRTRWDFRDSGGCRQTVSTFSVLDGMTFSRSGTVSSRSTTATW